MPDNQITISIPAKQMQEIFTRILAKEGFTKERALQCAEIFTASSVDGVYTHGVNRFPRFVQYVRDGLVNVTAIPSMESKYSGIEQWNGNLGAGMLNALFATGTVLRLAQEFGIGCVAMKNTNHWMRGGTYGWQAAKEGYVFIGWTNTIANMPAWGAKDAKLGNNPLVVGLPYRQEAIVLDMAMSQYSYGSLELSAMKNETLPVDGGFDSEGILTTDPSAILASGRPVPTGYWKGSGLALLLDVLATILSGGLSTHQITEKGTESRLSQVFIAIDISKLGNYPAIEKMVEEILNDYHQSAPLDEYKKIIYPGERVLRTRKNNIDNGIPVVKKVWDEICRL